jgi:hypothetical protein
LEILIFLLQLPSSLLDFCRFRIRFFVFRIRVFVLWSPPIFPSLPWFSLLTFYIHQIRVSGWPMQIKTSISAKSFWCAQFGLPCLMSDSGMLMWTVYLFPLLCLNSVLGIFEFFTPYQLLCFYCSELGENMCNFGSYMALVLNSVLDGC